MHTVHRTSDLYYAAYLKTAAVEFLGTEREGSKVVFLFAHSEAIRDLKKQFFSRRARVCALTYSDEIKALKTLTHMED